MQQEVFRERIVKETESQDTSILDIPLRLFNPYRILVLKILYLHGETDFRQLKFDLRTTDGNLASHLRSLEQGKYIEGHKEIVGKKPRTTYRLTQQGIEAFRQFVTRLSNVVQSHLGRVAKNGPEI